MNIGKANICRKGGAFLHQKHLCEFLRIERRGFFEITRRSTSEKRRVHAGVKGDGRGDDTQIELPRMGAEHLLKITADPDAPFGKPMTLAYLSKPV